MTQLFRLTPACRLSGPAVYKAILTRGARKRSQAGVFDVKFLANGLGYARLGFVIPKRLVPKAVHRNTIKRLIREAFRTQRRSLPAVDLVVRQIAKGPDLPKVRLRGEIQTLLASLDHV